MNILDLDVVPWLVILKYLNLHACIKLAAINKRIRDHVRRLAPTLMAHFAPDQYRDTDPFLRLLHSVDYIHTTAFMRFTSADKKEIEVRDLNYDVTCIRSQPITPNYAMLRPYRSDRRDPCAWWRTSWHTRGMYPPVGVQIYLLVYPPDGHDHAYVYPFLTLDRAIEHYIYRDFKRNIQWLTDLYNDCMLDRDPNAQVDIDTWLRQSNSPVVPYTRENVSDHLRQHMRTWPFADGEYYMAYIVAAYQHV